MKEKSTHTNKHTGQTQKHTHSNKVKRGKRTEERKQFCFWGEQFFDYFAKQKDITEKE